MRWQRLTSFLVLLVAFVALAAWQWDEYGRERSMIRETVVQQADSVMNALVGGIRSHRRLGTFFADNVQGVLDQLANSKDVLAVAIVAEDGEVLLQAGDGSLIDLAPPIAAGQEWDDAGLQRITLFRLPEPGGQGGAGHGGGWGKGRGARWEAEDEDQRFVAGKQYAAVLRLDRGGADRHARQAAWTRASIVAAGALVLFSVALMWRATVRLAEARGHARMLEAEARHLRDLGQAAAGLAHETRNPLGLIRGWTQRLAESGGASPAIREQARAVLEECDRVTARINQFLAFARPSVPQPQAIDPADVVEELAMLLEPDLESKRLTLGRLAPGNSVVADRELLRQALFNLMQNAVQSAPEGSRVEMALRRNGDGRVRLEVADCGPGVPPEAVVELFTPYFTLRPGGTGLGLAMVRHIATAHGWRAGYTPRPGGGSIFWLDGIHG